MVFKKPRRRSEMVGDKSHPIGRSYKKHRLYSINQPRMGRKPHSRLILLFGKSKIFGDLCCGSIYACVIVPDNIFDTKLRDPIRHARFGRGNAFISFLYNPLLFFIAQIRPLGNGIAYLFVIGAVKPIKRRTLVAKMNRMGSNRSNGIIINNFLKIL